MVAKLANGDGTLRTRTGATWNLSRGAPRSGLPMTCARPGPGMPRSRAPVGAKIPRSRTGLVLIWVYGACRPGMDDVGHWPTEDEGAEVPTEEVTMGTNGRVAIVTGGARGIGAAVARHLGRAGASVMIVDVDEDQGRAMVDDMQGKGLQSRLFVGDVTSHEVARRAVSHAVQDMGGLDIVVNNAGGFSGPPFPDGDVWPTTMAVNLDSVMLLTAEAVAVMATGGAIVNVASAAGLGLAPMASPQYAAAKAAVIRLTACLAPLKDRGIRVNCLCPGTVGTERVFEQIAELTSRGEELPPEFQGTFLGLDEVAEAVATLVSDEELAGRVMVCRGGHEPLLLPAEPLWLGA